MTAALWTQTGVLVVALLTLVGVIYTSRSSRRAADRATDTERLNLLFDRVDTLQAEVDELRAKVARRDQRIQVHIPWDVTAVEELRKKGVRIVDPPPLIAD
jgi:hypothetical protein